MLFFLFMLVLPTTFSIQRGFLLLPIATIAACASTTRWRLTKQIFLVWLLNLGASTLFVLHGAATGAPGALNVSTVYIIWPTLYILFIGLSRDIRTIASFERTLILGIGVASLLNMAIVYGALSGRSSAINRILSFQGALSGSEGGLMGISSFDMPTVIYGLPFLLALYLCPNKGPSLSSRKSQGIVLTLALLVCISSGRRGFWLIAALTPLLVGFFFLVARIRPKGAQSAFLLLAGPVVAIYGIQYLDIDLLLLYQRFTSAFDPTAELAASLRSHQLTALVAEWQKSPLIGRGLGHPAAHMVRSTTAPWSYELSYVALLFQTGIVGCLVYGGSVIWVICSGIRVVRRDPEAAPIMLPLLCGLTGFLISNATNPYLSKFDYLWTLFLPIAALNAYTYPRRTQRVDQTGTT